MKKINLELTKEQFLELMRLSFIWEIVINWHKIEDFDLSAKNFKKFIIKNAVEKNIIDYLNYFKWDNEYDYSLEKWIEFYGKLSKSHENYFNDEILENLVSNEIFSRYTEEQLDEMSKDEYNNLYSLISDEIEKEIEENGYENLRLNIKRNPLFAK